MNFVAFKVLWVDHDGMLQLAFTASSEKHSAYHETYIYPDSLAAFADGLKSFPTNSPADVVLVSGSKDPQSHDYLRLRIFLLKPTGQSALELESEVHSDPPAQAECHFFIPGTPADFNRIGAELSAWLADTHEPLRLAWRND